MVQAKEDSIASILGFKADESSVIFRRLGHICQDLGEQAEAVRFFKIALEKDPKGKHIDIDGVKKSIIRLDKPRPCYPAKQIMITKDFEGRVVSFYKVQRTNSKGRGVTLLKTHQPGERILTEEPIAVSVKPGRSYCEGCGRKSYASYPCDACTESVFCSEGCYLKNIEMHKIICGLLGVLQQPAIGKIAVLAIKLLVGEDKRWEKLRNHESDRSNLNSLKFHLLGAYICYLTGLRNLTKLVNVLYIVSINAIEVNDSVLALFDEISLLNHSCNPNVTLSFRENTICDVRALKKIDLGTEICISYGVTFSESPLRERQLKLEEKYFFTCKCRACRKEWPTRLLLPSCPEVYGEVTLNRVKQLLRKIYDLKNKREVTVMDFHSLRLLYTYLEGEGCFETQTQAYVETIKLFGRLMSTLGLDIDEFVKST